MSAKATEEMIIDALGNETEEDPFATDGESDYKPEGEKNKNAGEDEPMTSGTKRKQKSEPKRKVKGVKKPSSDLKNEEKQKLAELIKHEDIIFNLQNKLHSNAGAVLAAWQRVADKMNKSGNSFTFFFLDYIIEYLNRNLRELTHYKYFF